MTTSIDRQIMFDYTSLDTETRIAVQQWASEIRDRVRQTALGIIEIGERLIAVKERLPHGKFGDWLEVEFHWSNGTAYNFMNVARRFRSSQIETIAARALYLLAAPSAPASARAEALHRAESGESITHQTAKEIIARHKVTQPTLLPITADEYEEVPSVEFRRYIPPTRAANDEAALVQDLAAHLVAQGERVQVQVSCAVGVADLTTDTAIYEVKLWLTRENFINALGQVLLYRQAINPVARAVIVGFAVANVSLDDLAYYANQLDVEVLLCNS